MRKELRAKRKIQYDKMYKEQKYKDQLKRHSYKNAFRYLNFIRIFWKCTRGVKWKASVQNFIMTGVIKMYLDSEKLLSYSIPTPIGDRTTTIYERGKKRIITPIHIKDRIIQKLLCEHILSPILNPKLIYDNGASLEGKGVNFARKRVLHFLRLSTKQFNNDFYVLSFDFANYFDSIPHKTIQNIMEKYFDDPNIINLTMEIIKAPYRSKIKKIKDPEIKKIELQKLNNNEYHGMCLGSQVSQIMALIVPNAIDHYIKDTKKFKYYVRYMDDGVVFAKTKEELKTLYVELQIIAKELGLEFNQKKTRIIKMHKGFIFLKVKYKVTKTGKVIRKLERKGIIRMRRKLKSFKNKLNNGLMTIEDVNNSFRSWLEHSRVAQSYITVKNMKKLYAQLFKKGG